MRPWPVSRRARTVRMSMGRISAHHQSGMSGARTLARANWLSDGSCVQHSSFANAIAQCTSLSRSSITSRGGARHCRLTARL